MLLSVASDAHSGMEFAWMADGVPQARRGWDVLAWQQTHFEPLAPDEGFGVVRVDTTDPQDDQRCVAVPERHERCRPALDAVMIQDQFRGLGSGFDDSRERTPLCVDEALLDEIGSRPSTAATGN